MRGEGWDKVCSQLAPGGRCCVLAPEKPPRLQMAPDGLTLTLRASSHLAADVEAHAAEGVGSVDVELAHGVRAGSEQRRAAHGGQLGGKVQAWREERREQCHA